MKLPRFPLVRRLSAASGLLLFALASCRTAPAPVDTATMTAPKLVQAAQAEADKGNYQLALTYYQAIRDRFPNDMERSLWSSYEIAFLQYRMGKDDEAVRLFDELIKLYADRNDPSLPQGPRILSEKIRANILAKKKTP